MNKQQKLIGDTKKRTHIAIMKSDWKLTKPATEPCPPG